LLRDHLRGFLDWALLVTCDVRCADLRDLQGPFTLSGRAMCIFHLGNVELSYGRFGRISSDGGSVDGWEPSYQVFDVRNRVHFDRRVLHE
jgi:hypothetical protein